MRSFVSRLERIESLLLPKTVEGPGLTIMDAAQYERCDRRESVVAIRGYDAATRTVALDPGKGKTEPALRGYVTVDLPPPEGSR